MTDAINYIVCFILGAFAGGGARVIAIVIMINSQNKALKKRSVP